MTIIFLGFQSSIFLDAVDGRRWALQDLAGNVTGEIRLRFACLPFGHAGYVISG